MSTKAVIRNLKVLLAGSALLCAAPAFAQQVFRVTAITGESPTELTRKAAPLMKYVVGKLGMKVEFTPVTDDATAVEALEKLVADKKVSSAQRGPAVNPRGSVT